MAQYKIFEENMKSVKRELALVEKRCNKLGCEFKFEIVGEEFEEVENKLTKEKTVIKYIIVEAEGIAKINDWSFVATIQHTESGNIFFKAIDVEIPEMYRDRGPICEHCDRIRSRKDTYLIRNDITGEFKQVGKSCLKDFTKGMDANVIEKYTHLIETLSNGYMYDEFFGSCGGNYETYYNTEMMLSYFGETVKHLGYVKTDAGYDSTLATGLRFYRAEKRPNELIEKELQQTLCTMKSLNIDAESESSKQYAENVLAWAKEQEATNDYMNNVKVVTSLEYVTYKQLGILASVCSAYNKAMKIISDKAKKFEEEKNSNFVGSIGDRLTIEVAKSEVVTSWSSCYDGYHEIYTSIYKITDSNGNIYTWKTSSGYIPNDEKNVVIKGTVKAHNEYRGINQTELTRCKISW